MKINIRIFGYGGEVTIGTLSDKQYEAELESTIWPPTDWHENDDLFHVWGVSPNIAKIEITGPDWSIETPVSDLNDDPYNYKECYFDTTNTNIMVCHNGEKGDFFDGFIEMEEFDITKLKLIFNDIIVSDQNTDLGYEIINGVLYDGIEIDNVGGNTNGKSFDVNFFKKS